MAADPVRIDDRAPTARADDAVTDLYRRHGAEILRYCHAKLGSRPDAEDVAQSVFVRAYGALLRGERVRLPRHWLLRIARNECRRFVSRKLRVQEVSFDEELDVPPEEEAPRWSPDEIRRALDELVPTQRDALVLRELEGRSYADIAAMLGLTVSAVETLIFRARRALREQLDGAIACGAAEEALSLELDGRLPQDERPRLRAHLRACEDCRSLARRNRARRHALRTLLPFPLQGSLASLVGGGGAAAGGAVVGTSAAFKAIALLTAAAVSTGIGIRAAHPPKEAKQPPAAGLAAAPLPIPGARAVGTRTVAARAASQDARSRPATRTAPTRRASTPTATPAAGGTAAPAATPAPPATTATGASATRASPQPAAAVGDTIETTVAPVQAAAKKTVAPVVEAVEETVAPVTEIVTAVAPAPSPAAQPPAVPGLPPLLGG